MTITQTIENGKGILFPEGRLDTVTAPELEAAIQKILPSLNELTLDLEKLEYISSAGLRVLLSTHKALSGKGGLTVTHVNETISEIFEVTGFTDILTIR